MNNGFEFKISDVEVRVRRCYDESVDGQVIELTIEKVAPSWFLSSLCLTPEQATLISSALLHEVVTPAPLVAR